MTAPSIRKVSRSPLAASVLAGTLVFASLLGLRHIGALEALELAAYDWFMRLAPALPESPPRIVLIGITEQDIQNEGAWPLSDERVAEILTKLVESGPRAVGLDIFRDVPVGSGREALDAVFSANPNVVAVMKFRDRRGAGVSPPPVLAGTPRVGFSDVLVDPGGIVRRGLLFLDDGEDIAYSLALRLALLYLAPEGVTPRADATNPQHVRLGKSTIRPLESNDGGYVGADSRGYQFLLDFRDGSRAFPLYDLASVVSGAIAEDALRDKVVLLGVTAESVEDSFFTPLSRGGISDHRISGIALHARVVSQLLRSAIDGKFLIYTLREWQEAICILGCSLLGGLAGLWGRSPLRFSLIGAGGALLIGVSAHLVFLQGWWAPLVPSALGWLLSVALVGAYLIRRESEQRTVLMNLFSRHVSPEIANAIWRERDSFLSGGRPRPQRMTATVLFSDLQNYTAVAEKLEPEQFLDWLNSYMKEMTPLIAAEKGVILSFFGDAIMAVFGVPVPGHGDEAIRRDATSAVRCALAMESKLKALNRGWREQEQSMVGMRIGVFTGPVVTGSVGDGHRLEYMVQGDTVNTASRLESFDKEGFQPDFGTNHCRILIGEATRGLVGDQFQTEECGELKLKGKDRRVKVYRVKGIER